MTHRFFWTLLFCVWSFILTLTGACPSFVAGEIHVRLEFFFSCDIIPGMYGINSTLYFCKLPTHICHGIPPPPSPIVFVVGVVGKVTEATVEVISEDADEAGSLRSPLRLDVVASEATHKKLMLVRGVTYRVVLVVLEVLVVFFRLRSLFGDWFRASEGRKNKEGID